jgi:hypothetical protein
MRDVRRLRRSPERFLQTDHSAPALRTDGGPGVRGSAGSAVGRTVRVDNPDGRTGGRGSPMNRRAATRMSIALASVLIAVLGVQRASAQDGLRLTLAAGVSEFDLSGTGTSFTAAARLDGEVTELLILEGSVGVSFPDQQFGDTTTFVVPEVQVQVQWPARLAPYLGVGAGVAMDFRNEQDGGTQTWPTFSASGGARLAVAQGLGLRAELRVRGVEEDFAGSAAEFTAGLSWRF